MPPPDQTDKGIMCLTSERSFSRLLPNLWIRRILKRMNEFCDNWQRTVVFHGQLTAWIDQLWESRGQRSRPHEDEDGYGGLAEALFSTPLRQVGFLGFPSAGEVMESGAVGRSVGQSYGTPVVAAAFHATNEETNGQTDKQTEGHSHRKGQLWEGGA